MIGTAALVIVSVLLFVGSAWYVARFVREYRDIKRKVQSIRRSGHAKSTVRRMKQDAARRKRRKK